jgi:hypothetical protein
MIDNSWELKIELKTDHHFLCALKNLLLKSESTSSWKGE